MYLAVWWLSANMPRFASRFARRCLQGISRLSHHGFFDMEGYRLLIGKRALFVLMSFRKAACCCVA
jgi:hypothetical protein